MREIRDRVGGEIDAVSGHLDQQMNPLSFKFLRKAFGVACDNTDEISSEYKNYWLGHAPRYSGAYSGLTVEKQREKYNRLAEERLNYSAVIGKKAEIEEYDEKLDAFGKTIEELVQDKKELKEEIADLNEKYKRIEERREESDEIMNRLFQDEEFREFVKEKLKEL